MLLTETVKYRNRDIPLMELKPNTNKKVWVLCPDCLKVRETYWKSYLNSKSDKCHNCTNKSNSKDIEIDKRFGNLTVIDNRRSGYSICKCDCGEITEIANSNLRKGHTRSCGCLKSDNLKNAVICTGSKHGNWKGGITPENVSIRKSIKYKQWRELVFERDDYTCQDCGQKGYSLRAHHIHDFASNNNLRLDIDNGITLCDKCHKKLHKKYGNKTSIKDLTKKN